MIARPVKVIALFNENGKIEPIKFKIEEESSSEVVVIKRILKDENERLAGKEMKKFTCSSTFNGVERIIELKYDISSSKWILFKC